MPNKKGCVGSYPVSGYTRRDGTEVSGYIRRCGAAHASQEDKMQRRADILYPSMNVLEGRVEKNEYPEGNEPQGGESPSEDKVDWGIVIEIATAVAEGLVEGLENVKTTPLLGQSIYDVQNTEISQSPERRIASQTGDIGLRSLNKQSQQQGVGATKKEKDYDEIANIFYPTMSDNKAVEILKEKGKQELSEIEKERWNEHKKNAALAALDIGTSLIPAGSGAKVVYKVGKTLTPKLSKAITKALQDEVVQGTIVGGTYGASVNAIEGKDPITGAAIGAATGGLTVGALKNLKATTAVLVTNTGEVIPIKIKEGANYIKQKSYNLQGGKSGKIGKDSETGKIVKAFGQKMTAEEAAIFRSEMNTYVKEEDIRSGYVTKCIGSYKYWIYIYEFNEYMIIKRRQIK